MADEHDTFWTPSGVRLRRAATTRGELNWLFLPGGPGIGSESLQELVEAIAVPGTCWLVDLPGDGSNTDAPGAPADPYSGWPQVLLEAAHAVPDPVLIGHSTGGEYLLSTPALAECLRGMVLISTAPDASWMRVFAAMCQRNPLPRVEAATARYEADPSPENLRDVAVESAPWNFVGDNVAAGAELLGRMPYNPAAVVWSDENFDHTYESFWWPEVLPTLIVSGAEDRIVIQSLWDAERFRTPNVIRRVIDGAAHFPWIERPDGVRDAFAALIERIQP